MEKHPLLQQNQFAWLFFAASLAGSSSCLVHAQPDVEVLRDNLQLAQTGLVILTALSNIVLTLARGEERAESFMRDLVGITYAVRYALFSSGNVEIDSAYLSLLRCSRAKVQWKISDVPFAMRICSTQVYQVIMLAGEYTERRAALVARWLWYNFNADTLILQIRDARTPRLQKEVGGTTCNCLYYEIRTEIEQWLADHFESVFVVVSDGDKEYLRLRCAACSLAANVKSFLTEDNNNKICVQGILWVLPNCKVLQSHVWLRILQDLVVLKDEVDRGSTGAVTKDLVDGLDQGRSSTRKEATHTRNILLGMLVESTISLLLCAFVKIVPYISSVIGRRVVRSIVTGMTSKTQMVMPPGAILTMENFEDKFPALCYEPQRGQYSIWQSHANDWIFPLFAAGLGLGTFITSHVLWALSLGGFIPPLVGAHGPLQTTVFNITVVIVSLSIWLAGTSWRIWKGELPIAFGPNVDRVELIMKTTLQMLFFTTFTVLSAFLVLCYTRAMHGVMSNGFWIICASTSLLSNTAFCIMDSLFFKRIPDTTVVDPGTTVFQFAHIASQAMLSLITGNIV